MDKTSSRIALAVPAPAADPHHAQPPAEEAQETRTVLPSVACLLRVNVALMTCSAALSAWQARQDPVELAVFAGLTALLPALFVCLHCAEWLTPGSPPGEWRRLYVAIWVLPTLIFCLVIAAWSVTSFFGLWSFFMLLVLHKNQQYQELDGVDDRDAAAGDGKAAFKTARTTDE